MPAKKPSAKPTRPKKTVSARTTAKPAAKPVKKAKAAPAKPASKAPPTRAHASPAAVKATTVKPTAKVTSKAPVKAVAKEKASASEPAMVIKTVQPPRPAVDLRPGMSLLSGPRNVEPYVPRKGEEYMSKEQLDHFRYILSSWKQDLMQEVDRTMLHMKDEASNFPDPNDRATQESEFSLELRTRDRERKLIRKIDEALKRIEDGSYGYCLETGEPIGVKRLEARPVATLSVEAQERRERREKQFGDRDDR
jgi:DnaK suppressor protein